jgi:plasmid stability protein
LLIKNMPEELHKKLKEQAKKHRRSMTQEAITILEQELLTPSP